MFKFAILLSVILISAIFVFSQSEVYKTTEQLITNLRGEDRKSVDLAVEELAKRGEKSASLLIPIAADKNEDQFIRVRAIYVLGRIKNENSIPTLTDILSEENSYITGKAAYALSKLGGDKAKDALFNYLERSFKGRDNESLPRALEAIKETHDKRAFPILMEILKVAQKQNDLPANRDTEDDLVQRGSLEYAVEALGNIGDPKASVEIAKFLAPDIPYHSSKDYVYLEAICKTKGKEVIPHLVSYLEAKVKSLAGKEQPTESIGAGNRQIISDLWRYKKTTECLENITDQKGIGSTRKDILMFWKQYAEVHNLNKTN